MLERDAPNDMEKHILFNRNLWTTTRMKYIPESGKPLWISLEEDVHHIFFDDNIHNKAGQNC